MTTAVTTQTPPVKPGAPLLPLSVQATFALAAGADASALPFAVGSILAPAVVNVATFNGLTPVPNFTLSAGSATTGAASVQVYYPTVLLTEQGCDVPLPLVSSAEQAAWAAALTVTLNSSAFKTPLLVSMNAYFGPTTVTGVTFSPAAFQPVVPGLC